MADDLVEELARRLARLFVASLHEPVVPPGRGPDIFPSPTFYDMTAVARECLRQMEWARGSYEVHRCRFDCAGCKECDPPPPQKSLTLAPPDWTP